MGKRDLDHLPSIQEVPYNGLVQPISKVPPPDLIRVSSIDKSSAQKSPSPISSKPAIDRVAQLMIDQEQLAKKYIDRFERGISSNMNRLNELERETMQKIQDSAETTKDWNFWQFLQDIGNAFISALSIGVGSFFVTSTNTPLVGAALIASGLLAITNFVFEQTDLWDSIAKQLAGNDLELEKNIRSMFPAALSLVSTVLALGGTATAVYLHSMDLTQKLFSFGQSASNLIQGTLVIGTGVHESRAKFIEIDLEELRSLAELTKYSLEFNLKKIEEVFEFTSKSIEETHFYIKADFNAIQCTFQPA